jgi:hypothetical protein
VRHRGAGVRVRRGRHSRCAADPEFGAEFRERLLRVLARRLQGTRTRLIAGSMSDGA